MDNEKKNFPKISSQALAPIVGETNFFEAFMHLFKGYIGVGLFAMGYAYKNGGLFVSLVLTVFLSTICLHCQHLLVNYTEKASFEHYEEVKPIEYSEAIELCFLHGPARLVSLSRIMGIICDVFIAVTQFGFCCIYLTVIAANVQQILLKNDIVLETHYMLMIIWVPIWIASLITNLKALAPISSMANVFLVISFAIVIFYAIKDGIPNLSERKLYANDRHLMICISAIIFSFEGVGVVLPIKNSMRHPKQFRKPFGVLNLVMVVVVSMYVVCGFFGYSKWGEDVRDTLTLNIGDSITAQCTKALLALGISFTYPLQFFVPCNALAPAVIRKFNCEKRELLCQLIFRSVLSLMTLLTAIAFPNIGVFISLVGGLCSTVLAIAFPIFMDCLAVQKTESKCLKCFKLIKNCIILMIAFLSFTLGTYINITEVVKYFKESRTLE